MTPEERQMLTQLADRIKGAPNQQHDAEADDLLSGLVRARPDTAYLLAQTVLMQDLAMRNAQAQITDLQQQLQAAQAPVQQRSSGSFLSGLFGGSAAPPPASGPWGQAQYAPGYAPVVMQPSQTSGFLRSAATTAAGIAGGALLFEGLESLFGGHQGYGGFMSPMGWGGWGGGGDFGPRESISETTINNNYYDTPAPDAGQQQADFGGDQGNYQDVSDSGSSFDGGDFSGGDFGGGSDDFST